MSAEILELQGCVVHLAQQRVVTHAGAHVRLTTREAELLRYLAARPSRDVSRDELLTEVWGYPPEVLSRATDNTMNRLRDKVEQDASNPVHLLTVHGHGYRFEPLVPEVVPVVAEAPAVRLLELGACTVDLSRRRVHRNGEEIALTTVEAGLLEVLADRSGRDVPRRDLLAAVWGIRGRNSRALDTTVRRLRAKIEPDPSDPTLLQTVRGHGYRLDLPSRLPDGEVALVHTGFHNRHLLLASAPEVASSAATTQGEVLEPLVLSHGGAIVRREDDAWRLCFAAAEQALRWCLAAQRALIEAPWSDRVLAHGACAEVRREGGVVWRGPRVDMSVVAGRAELTTDPVHGRTTYKGPLVAQADWLLAQCAPGQVLVAPEAWQPLEGAVGVEVELRDEPGHAIAAVPDDLRARGTDQALDVEPEPPPTFTSPLLGRSDELATLGRHLAGGARLITLVGPGGIGKTRLAAALVAGSEAAGFSRKAWASAATARDGCELVDALALALGTVASCGDAPLAAVALGRRVVEPTLLVVDELEQVEDDARQVLEPLLEACPALVVVATSRHRLGLALEQPVELGALDPTSARALLRDRAGDASAPDAALDRIAARVEGVPLALELAGSRARLLGVRGVAERLDADLGLLRTPGGSGRRASLAASVGASWALLRPWEKAAAAQLSVLGAPFSAEAAEAVLALPDEAPPVLDVLEELARRSLLSVRHENGVAVLQQYAVVRACAGEHLADREPVLQRHAAFFAGYGDPRFLDALDAPGAAARRAELLRARPHLEAALEHTLARSDLDHALRLARALHQVLLRRGPAEAGVRLSERLLALPDVGPAARAWLHVRLARHLRTQGRWSVAREHAAEGARLALAGDDPGEAVYAVLTEALILVEQRHPAEAARAYQRAELLAQEAGRLGERWFARARAAAVDPELGVDPIACLHEAIREAEAAGRHRLASVSRHALGIALIEQHREREAVDVLVLALGGLLACDDPVTAAFVRMHLADALLGLVQLERAAWHLGRAAASFHQLGMQAPEAVMRTLLARVEGARGAPEAALEQLERVFPLLEGSEASATRVSAHLESVRLHLAAGSLDAARAHLEQAGEGVLVDAAAALLAALEGRDDADATMADVLRRAEASDSDELRLIARSVAVRVAAALGQMDEARARLEALEAWQPDVPRWQVDQAVAEARMATRPPRR